jgi:hypothetical protein
LWNDQGIRSTFQHRSHFQLTDSTDYFFDRLSDISAEEYVPTQQDVFRSRVRTTGIVETDFEIRGHHFKMVDVGGQRNERRKWINCFEGVTAVLFVAAISEFDQVLYEDETVNRMHEALSLFGSTVNSKTFFQTDIILFLNKRDLFAEKLKLAPLIATGSQDYGICVRYMENEFISLNKNKNRTMRLIFVFLALIALAWSAAPPTANLLVQKHISADPFIYIGEGRNFTSHVTVYNVGEGAAYDVVVSDPWPSNFNVLEGKTTMKFEEIAAGGKVELNLTLSPAFNGEFESFPAVVQYKATEAQTVQDGSSNVVRDLVILSTEHFDKRTAKHYREWALFSGLSLLTILLPLFVWTKVQVDYPNGVPAKKKN